MKTKILIFVFTLLVLLLTPQKIHAQDKAAGDSAGLIMGANLLTTSDKTPDYRAVVLQNFLEQYDKTFAQQASSFVKHADENNIDWKLVPAISGVESTFGQAVPADCNNAFGYGIYTNHMECFSSYDEAISTVSKALRENYMDKWGDTTVYAIGHDYAASPSWSSRVVYFMDQIDQSYQKFLNDHKTLPISL